MFPFVAVWVFLELVTRVPFAWPLEESHANSQCWASLHLFLHYTHIMTIHVQPFLLGLHPDGHKPGK